MKVHLPESAQEAVSLLGEGVVVAGGTHDRSRACRRPTRSSACAAPACPASPRTATACTVGATTTLTELAREVEFLREAVNSIASPTIRNMGTVGGNLFVPQPHGDLAVCLLALDAEIEKEGDLVTGVSFTVPERWFYRKAMRRKQNSASIVTVASDGTRIALGGVASEPVRATKAEEALAAGDIDAAAELCLEVAEPFDDAYASAWYRRRVLPVHVRRAFAHAV